MDTSATNKLVQQRLIALQSSETLGNVTEACRHRGRSKTQFYEYKRRFQIHGLDGPKGLPPEPHSPPQTTTLETAEMYCVGHLNGVGRVYLQAVADTYGSYGFSAIFMPANFLSMPPPSCITRFLLITQLGKYQFQLFSSSMVVSTATERIIPTNCISPSATSSTEKPKLNVSEAARIFGLSRVALQKILVRIGENAWTFRTLGWFISKFPRPRNIRLWHN